jgi:hypothetical protein
LTDFVRNAAAVIVGVTYGISISSTEDHYIAIAEKALDGMAKAASPGAFLVDLLPIRRSFVLDSSWELLLIYHFLCLVKYVPYAF